MRYHEINSHCGDYSVNELCECFSLKRGSYYAWKSRRVSIRQAEDAHFKSRIEQLDKRSKGRYGYRPIYHHLKEEGLECGRDRTLRLMREMGLLGYQKKRFKAQVSNSNHNFGYSPNLFKQLGSPVKCNQVWVADTTYLKTDEGWCYLATVMDLYSRRIVGWKVSSNNDSDLVCQALEIAALSRGAELPEDIIHHSDRGSTYASHAYRNKLHSLNMKASMSAKGNCYDNAAKESFFGRYKTSSVRKRVFADQADAQSNAFEYIELFYNRFRKHSALGYKNPIQFEQEIAPPMEGINTSITACINNN